jgi:hypothetical protein
MSQISKQALIVDNNQSFPTNNAGEITPSDLRAFNVNMIDSLVNEIPYQSFTASVTNSINLLNAFTASQQPSFTALNSFTASQLVINSGYNAATQSLNASVNSLTAEVDQLQIFSASVNQISDNGIVQGNSSRLHFYGLVSASIVPNTNGAIASIDILQDATKADSSSFNAFTASTNQQLDSLEVFSASAKVSIAAFGEFTASYGPVATGSLVATSSFSGNTITFTKGDGSTFTNVGIQNTASFNSYTASALTSLNSFTASQNTKNATLAPITASLIASQSADDTKWQTLGNLSGSFARINIGNSFTGSNIFSGSVITTGSIIGNVVSMSIVSSTASMNLNTGNFFSLNLIGSVATQLTATNIKAGQTINLLVTQSPSGSGTLTFSPSFKGVAGQPYTPTSNSGSQDILTFITFDTASVYLSYIKNLV